MNQRIFDELRNQAGHDEVRALAAAWDALDRALPEPASGRMRRRLRGLIRRERYDRWLPALPWAGMAAMLLLGLAVGRHTVTQAPVLLNPQNDTLLLSGVTTGVRLQAILNLRDTGADLPADAIQQLGRILASEEANMGLRLAALEALLAHQDQTGVQDRLRQVRTATKLNPMLEARLEEAGGRPAGASI